MHTETLAPVVASAPERSPRRAPSRYIGVDVARLLAIAGMMATHLIAVNALNAGAPDLDRVAGEVAQAATSGIAAPLFAVLGGVSLTFASRSMLRAGRRGAAIASAVLRGVLLIVIGLLLGLIVSPVVVVLVYYGAAMILASPLLTLRARWLVVIAVVVGVCSGPLNALARGALGVVNEGGSISFESLTQDPWGALRGAFLTGEYPALTWVVYLIVGMLIARALLSAADRGRLRSASGVIAAVGAATAVAASLISTWVVTHLDLLGVPRPSVFSADAFSQFLTMPSFGAPLNADPWMQLIATPHSGSVMDLLRTLGIGAAVIGLLVLLCDGIAWRRRSGVLEVVRAAGAAPLTVYALHVVVTGVTLTAVFADPAIASGAAVAPWWAVGIGAFCLQFGGAVALGAILARVGRRGPLEAIVSGAVTTVVRPRRS